MSPIDKMITTCQSQQKWLSVIVMCVCVDTLWSVWAECVERLKREECVEKVKKVEREERERGRGRGREREVCGVCADHRDGHSVRALEVEDVHGGCGRGREGVVAHRQHRALRGVTLLCDVVVWMDEMLR